MKTLLFTFVFIISPGEVITNAKIKNHYYLKQKPQNSDVHLSGTMAPKQKTNKKKQ